MKTRFLHQWLLITGTIGLLASSSTTYAQQRNQQATRYPDGSVKYPNGTVRYPDGSVRYPGGRTNDRDRRDRDRDRDWERDRDRNWDNDRWERDGGPVVIVDGNGRRGNDFRHLPPGHAKKVYGYKSARNFSPGQRKKLQKRYGYVPPIVVSVPDRYCKRGNGGRYYYTDRGGFTYWRDRDGFYVLDNRYF